MTFRQFLLVVEIRTKIISVSTYLLATFYAVAAGASISPLTAVLLAVAVLCVDMGTTAFNTFYDYVRGVDSPLLTVEPDKVLLHEGVAPAHALLASLALYAVAAATGFAVAALTSWWIIAAGVVCMLVGFFYNGGPLPISRTPFGELFAGGFLGAVLFLVVYHVHAGEVTLQALLASVPSTLLIAAVLMLNNTCDIDGDRAAGRRTLSIVIGPRGAPFLVDLLCAGSYIVLAVVIFAEGAVTLEAAADGASAARIAAHALHAALVGTSAAMLAGMHRRGYSHATKHRNMAAMMRIVIVYTAVYAAMLALAA